MSAAVPSARATAGRAPTKRAGRPPRNDERLYVAEVFGPTVQGEGPSRGQLAAFVRLGAATCAAPGAIRPTRGMPHGSA